MTLRHLCVCASLCLPAAILLTGCSTSFSPTAASGQSSAGEIHGNVHGGQQPISGAEIYLLEAGKTGYSSHFQRSLLGATYVGSYPTTADGAGNYYVTTDANGGFDLTGDYTCDVGAQVYIYSYAGNPGAGNNTAATMVALLGQCPASQTMASVTPYVYMNELSTVAAVYATAGFGSSALTIGAPANAAAQANLANAFATSANLYNVGLGYASTTTGGGNGTVPQTKINTLGNIIASCINSSGPSSTACFKLFANAMTNGETGSAPSDVTTAVYNIAHNPGNTDGISAIFPLQTAQSPFQPSLASAPNDFTMSINYTGGGLSGPTGVAIDASGNIWVANHGAPVLSKFDNFGTPLSGVNGFSGGGLSYAFGIAIDSYGNAWVASLGSDLVSEFTSSGQAIGTGYNPSGDCIDVAIDASGNVWTSNLTSNSVSKLNSSGVEQAGFPVSPGGTSPRGVAIDASGNVWIPDSGSSELSELSKSTGATMNGSPFTSGSPGGASFVEIDANGGAWTANTGEAAVTHFTSAGVGTNDSTIQGSPTSLILDGAGNVWISNSNATITELSSGGVNVSPSGGFTGTLDATYGIAVDGSGNVWVSNLGSSSLSEFVGAATPTVTPLVAAVIANNIAGQP